MLKDQLKIDKGAASSSSKAPVDERCRKCDAKADKINELNHSLSETRKQLEKLRGQQGELIKSSSKAERRLKEVTDELKEKHAKEMQEKRERSAADKTGAERTISELKEKLDETKTEILLLRSASKAAQKGSGSSVSEEIMELKKTAVAAFDKCKRRDATIEKMKLASATAEKEAAAKAESITAKYSELKKLLKKEREEHEMLKQETARIMKRAFKIHDQLEQYESDSMSRNSCRWFRKEPPLSASKEEVESWNDEDAQARYVPVQDDTEQPDENLDGWTVTEDAEEVLTEDEQESATTLPVAPTKNRTQPEEIPSPSAKTRVQDATIATEDGAVTTSDNAMANALAEVARALTKSSEKQDVMIDDFHIEACPTIRKDFQKWVTNLCDELNRRSKCHDRLETQWVLKATKGENDRDVLKDVCYPFKQSTRDERMIARWERLDRILYQKLLKMKGTPPTLRSQWQQATNLSKTDPEDRSETRPTGRALLWDMAQYFRHGKSTPKYKIMLKFKMCVWVGDHIHNLVELLDGLRELMDEFTDYGRIAMTETEKEEWRDHLATIMGKSKIPLIQDSLKEFDKDLAAEVDAKDGEKATFEFLIDAINRSIKKMTFIERKENEEKAAASLAGAFMGMPQKGTGRGKGKDSDRTPKGGGKESSQAGGAPTDPREPKGGKGKKGKQPSQGQATWNSPNKTEQNQAYQWPQTDSTKGQKGKAEKGKKGNDKGGKDSAKGSGGKDSSKGKGKNNNTNVEWSEGSQHWQAGGKKQDDAKGKGKGKVAFSDAPTIAPSDAPEPDKKAAAKAQREYWAKVTADLKIPTIEQDNKVGVRFYCRAYTTDTCKNAKCKFIHKIVPEAKRVYMYEGPVKGDFNGRDSERTAKGKQKGGSEKGSWKGKGDGGKAESDPSKGTKALLLGPKETGPDGKALGVNRLQPASPAFPMMAPITESADGSQRYALTDCREELQKSEDKHKSVNDKLRLIKQTEAPQSSRQQEYDRLFNGTNARSSKECDETPMVTVSTLAPAKKITRRSLVGRVRPTPVTTGARSSSDADPHGTVTGEEAAAQTANAAAWSEAEDDQHEPPSPASVSSSIRRDIYFGEAQPSSSRLRNESDQRTQVFPRPETGYQHGHEGMPTYAYFQRQD